MNNKDNVTLLKTISHLNLSQWLSPQQNNYPVDIYYHEAGEFFSNTTTDITTTTQNKDHFLELVVYSHLSVASFALLLSKCKINLLQLTACNTRNAQTSYRFLVSCNDSEFSRQQLIQLTLLENFEAALLKNAPFLSKPGLLVMDMDSTTIKIECIDEIAALAGVGEDVAQVTERAMQGELDFAQSLHQRVSKLTDAPVSILNDVVNNLPLMQGLQELVQGLKQHNWRIAIASGGFTYFADHLKDLLTLDAAIANTLEIKNNKLTGKVLGKVIDAQAKADCIHTLQQKFSIEQSQTVAMGDGANDLNMMATAHLGVAFHAKPVVLAQADTCITKQGLDCLLHWLR